jgi:GcrA cell cycle regulator
MSLPQATTVYSSPEGFWTEPRVTELRALFDKGLSNNQIAVAMGVKTRSAVIGKLHRLGLRREAVATVSKQSRGARGIVNRVQQQKPQRALEAFVRTKPISDSPALESDGVTDIAIEASADRISLLRAGAKHCLWPAADDGSATMVCGSRIIAGSFCARHARRGFQRPDALRGRAVGV